MVNAPKMAHFNGKFAKKASYHGKFLLRVILPWHLRNFFPHALNKTTQPVLGKLPTKVKISMTISNSEQQVRYMELT
jgi:hypothetical protein